MVQAKFNDFIQSETFACGIELLATCLHDEFPVSSTNRRITHVNDERHDALERINRIFQTDPSSPLLDLTSPELGDLFVQKSSAVFHGLDI